MKEAICIQDRVISKAQKNWSPASLGGLFSNRDLMLKSLHRCCLVYLCTSVPTHENDDFVYKGVGKRVKTGWIQVRPSQTTEPRSLSQLAVSSGSQTARGNVDLGREGLRAILHLFFEKVTPPPYDTQNIDPFKNEQFEPEHLKINLKGVVPALDHDGRIVIEFV